MQTMADLTVSDWAKISPDLKWSLEQAARFPTWRVRDLEGGIPILTGLWTAGIPGIFGGGIRSDVVIMHADRMQYFIHDVDIPAQWTGRMWTDFVVGLVRSPFVLEAGTLREWPIIGVALEPEGAIRVTSPHELAMVAGRAPARTVTPQPQPQLPPPPPRRQLPHQPLPGELYPDGPPMEGAGPVQRFAGTLGISPTMLLVGGAAVAGLLVVTLVVARKKVQPVKERKRRIK